MMIGDNQRPTFQETVKSAYWAEGGLKKKAAERQAKYQQHQLRQSSSQGNPKKPKIQGQPSVGQKHLCRRCGKNHLTKQCYKETGARFHCGQLGHQVRDCPNSSSQLSKSQMVASCAPTQ
ncbi:hypothetical protein AAC387_Pa01g2139 [Persea americana]